MPTRTDKPLSPPSQYLFDELRRDNRSPARLYDHWLLLIRAEGRAPQRPRDAFNNNVAYIRRRIAGIPHPQPTPEQRRRSRRLNQHKQKYYARP